MIADHALLRASLLIKALGRDFELRDAAGSEALAFLVLDEVLNVPGMSARACLDAYLRLIKIAIAIGGMV